jgi:hypothetical protein
VNVYSVFLRRPRDLQDKRADPFWEFGSFGSTGCHAANLLHPRRSPVADGDRLAFLQGGAQEIRVIALTPSVRRDKASEVVWKRSYRPWPYVSAPLLIDNRGETDFPAAIELLAHAHRSTPCGAAASRLRTRTKPLPAELARQLVAWFSKHAAQRIQRYTDAICAPDHPWYRNALAQGWTRRAERLRDYTGGGGAANGRRRVRRC